MTTDQTAALREHLLYLLRGGSAHLDFEKAIAGLPPDLRGAKPAGQPHTPWRLLEHSITSHTGQASYVPSRLGKQSSG